VDDDEDGDDGVWLEFRQLDECRHQSATDRRLRRRRQRRRSQIRRSKLVVYVHNDDTDAGKYQPQRTRQPAKLKTMLLQYF